MFASLLHDDDARRAAEVVTALLAHGLRCALTGGLAIDAQLRVHGRSIEPRALNDIDFVVQDFASIPGSLAASFVSHHVHPAAIDGKTLLQLVDQQHAMRIDLFHALGSTLSRAIRLDSETGELNVLSVEDLVARTTALVCGRLRRGQSVDVTHATAFSRLFGLGRREHWRRHGTTTTNRCPELSTEPHVRRHGYWTPIPS